MKQNALNSSVTDRSVNDFINVTVVARRAGLPYLVWLCPHLAQLQGVAPETPLAGHADLLALLDHARSAIQGSHPHVRRIEQSPTRWRFYFTFGPRRHDPAHPAPLLIHAQLERTPKPGELTLRVAERVPPSLLLATKDPQLANEVGFTCQRAGIELLLVTQAAQVRPAVRQRRFDLFLLDADLPDLGGVTGLRQLAVQLKGVGIPLIVSGEDEALNQVGRELKLKWFGAEPAQRARLINHVCGFLRCG